MKFIRVEKNEKLLLEDVYEIYCKRGIEGLEEEDNKFYNMIEKFIEFRLYVSGGRFGSSMGRIGMESVEGFINEIEWFDSMMSDWSGSYRGDYSYECLESLKEILDEKNIREEIKNEIIKLYKDRNKMWEDEE